MFNVHTALQELQAVVLMLCGIVFTYLVTLLPYIWITMLSGGIGSRMASSFSHCLNSISTLGSTGGGFFYILMPQVMSALLHLGNSIISSILVVVCFKPSYAVSGELCISFCGSSPISVQVSGITFHRPLQTSDSCEALLDGGSLFPTVLNIWQEVPHLFPMVKDLSIDVSIDQVL